jgi:hypothetical protein
VLASRDRFFECRVHTTAAQPASSSCLKESRCAPIWSTRDTRFRVLVGGMARRVRGVCGPLTAPIDAVHSITRTSVALTGRQALRGLASQLAVALKGEYSEMVSPS